MAFMCLSRTRGTAVEVRILHRMIRYFELPGAVEGGMVDLSLGLLGDVRAAQVPVVEVDNTDFSLIGGTGVRVPTVAFMLDQLEAAPPGSFLGPYAADAPGTELVRPRTTQVLPIKYASILIHRDGVSPAAAYPELHGILEADDALETCGGILAWLRVACTARGGAGDLAALPAVAKPFPLSLLPANISEYVAAKVRSDLPGRNSSGSTVGDVTLAAVQQLAENVGGGRSAQEPKGIMEAYRETYTVLQRYCHVSTVEELAPLWGRLARGGAKVNTS